MIFFILILFFILFKSSRISPANEFNKEYLSLENTNIIKGVFVILVVFKHSSQYIHLSGVYDDPYLSIEFFMGQMIVSMFLFYSGYGIMESISKKGFSYIKSIPTQRFIKVLVNFDIAVLLFLIVDIIIGKNYEVQTTLLAFTGWENIGNSNWYILAVLVLYILTFVSFFLIKWFDNKPMHFVYVIILTLLSMAFVYFEMKMGKESWYYNTIILFPFGCWYSLLKTKIEAIVQKNDFMYSITAAIVMIGLFISYTHKGDYGIWGYSVWGVFFTMSIVMFTMKFSFKSTLLSWFGNHVFSVFILQRIPMMILHHMGIAAEHKYFFIIITFIITVFIAQIFDYFTDLLWKKIYSKKK